MASICARIPITFFFGGAGAGAEPKCPICRRTWEFKEAEMAHDEDQENGGDEDDDDDDDERMDVTDAMP